MHRISLAVIIILLLSLGLSFGRIHQLSKTRVEADTLKSQVATLQLELKNVRPRSAPVLASVPAPVPPAAAATQTAAPSSRPAPAVVVPVHDERDQTIAALSTELARIKNEVAEREARVEAEEKERRERREAFVNRFRQNLDELKKTDPERYEAIQKQREESRERMTDGMARQSAFFLNLDPEKMTEDEKLCHNRLIEIMQENWKCMETLDGEADSEAVDSARHTLHENMGELRDLLPAERQVALTQMARDMGQSETESKAFADAVAEIYDLTSFGNYWRGRHPERDRSRGGPRE